MKKNSFILLAIATLSLVVACNKAVIEETPVDNLSTIELSFNSEKPALLDESLTKTAWVEGEKTINWSKADKIRVAVKIGENWQNNEGNATPEKGPKLYISNEAGSDAAVVDFKVSTSFSLSASGDYSFYGIYPSSVTGTDARYEYMPSITVTLPTEQTPDAGTFDPSADIMIAESAQEYQGIPSDRVISLNWSRLVAHGDITLKKLPAFAEGEIIRSITLTAQEGADLSGVHYLDLVTGEFSLPNGATAVNSITIKANGDNLVKNSDGNIEFWFASLPFTATSLTAVITTNMHVYTKSYPNISGGKEFQKNARNILGISMSNCSVEDAPEEQLIADGVYVISSGDKMMVANPDAKYQISAALSTTIEDGKICVDNDAAWKLTFDATASVYYIQSIEYETYLGGLSNSGSELYLKPSSDKVGFTIEAVEDGYHIVGTNSRWIGYNYNNGSDRFAMYQNDSNYPGILTLTPAKIDETPVLSINNITLSSAAAVSGATITPATAKNINRIVVNGVFNESACSSTANWISVSYTNDALVYTAEANNGDARTAYVSVKGLNGDGVETGNIVFSITQPKYVSYANQWVLVTDVTELAVSDKIVIVSTDGTKALGTTQNSNNRAAVNVSLDANDNNIVIITEDVQQITLGQTNSHWTLYTGTGYLYAASSSSNHLKTQTTNNANGEWTIDLNDSNEATIKAQGSNTRNIIKNNGTIFSCYESGQTAVKIYKFHSDGRPSAPISWSEEEGLIEITNDGQEELLPSLNNNNALEVTYSSSNPDVAEIDANGNITANADGNTTISATFTATSSSEFSTTTVGYELTVTDNRTYTITINQPSVTGCTISASPSGAQKANTEITLSVTATADGYKFSKWVVKDATNNDVTVTSDKFNMPQSNVVVTAEFVEDSGQDDPTSVVYDFTKSGWSVSDGTLTDGTVSFTGQGGANFKMNSGYFMMGKSGAYINFPTYSYPVTKIVVTGNSGASASVKQNIFVGDTAVSTETTGATGANTYSIASGYQAAGTIYTLKVTSSHNTQITKIEVFFN